jgi:hypothetical protein
MAEKLKSIDRDSLFDLAQNQILGKVKCSSPSVIEQLHFHAKNKIPHLSSFELI